MASNVDKAASGHIKQLLAKVLVPVLKAIRNPPDYFEEYKSDYGYLGPNLLAAVMKARSQPAPATTPSTPSNAPAISAPVGPTISRTVTATVGIMQQQVRYDFCNILENA